MAAIAERSQKLVAEFLARQQAGGGGNGNLDPLYIGAAFMEMTGRMMADPAKLVQALMNLWQDYFRLWQSTAPRMMGQAPDSISTPAGGARRFEYPEWAATAPFDFAKHLHLLYPRWMSSRVTVRP